MVDSWGWSVTELKNLDNRIRWRAEDVVTLRRVVVAELIHSYRLLSRLARHHGTRAAISSNDMNLLGRKLYAAFQRKAGKVEQINPGLALPGRRESGVPSPVGTGWFGWSRRLVAIP